MSSKGTTSCTCAFAHHNPEGTIYASIVGIYCACVITSGFDEARYEDQTGLWDEALADFISTIITNSDLCLDTTVGALSLIDAYQMAVKQSGQSMVVDEVEEVMKLFVAAYIIADEELAGCDGRILLSQWKHITGAEWTSSLWNDVEAVKGYLDNQTTVHSTMLAVRRSALVAFHHPISTLELALHRAPRAGVQQDLHRHRSLRTLRAELQQSQRRARNLEQLSRAWAVARSLFPGLSCNDEIALKEEEAREARRAYFAELVDRGIRALDVLRDAGD